MQNDPVALLTARVATLEEAATNVDVPTRLAKITQYGFRREEDFDKYDALSMAEQLATAAKSAAHEKASSYDVIACTLREKLPVPKKQFKAYFLALLADKEYAKVLEAVSKVDKTFKSSSSPSGGSAAAGAPAQLPTRPGPRRPRVYCYACGAPGHIASSCYRRSAGRGPYQRGPRPLMQHPYGK
ncbi:hypothetical protein AC249_AIPGENE14767 [Exaiptasia diaphana]|nr:hypothetical protein AC249_AIPGENE14767 [Exaiptasia diaphana]